MAFVSGYEHDIFISYCHIDNLPVEDINWIDRFHERLEVALWQKEGRRQIKIWRDRELDGSQRFDQTLSAKLAASAILLCLHSPGYRESEYCSRERNWFRDANEKRLDVGDRSRIFNVLLYRMPQAEWPSAFQGAAGFPFYLADRPASMGYPLPVKSGEFTERLHGLADALFATLQAMQQAGATPARQSAGAQPARPPGPRVFIAKVSDALAVRKKRVIADLTQEGFEVIESAPPPFENPAHDETVQQRIKEAELAVHLLDQYPGTPMPGGATGYIQRQVEIGRELRTPQLIWVPKDLTLSEDDADEPDEIAYRAFLNRLETAVRGDAEYDFIRGIASDIPAVVRDRIQSRKVAPPAPSQTAILLDVHYKDHPYVTDLYRYLAERGIQPLLMPEQDDPRASEGLFVEQLKRVSAMIVFFGHVAADWVVERLFAAAKIKTVARCRVEAFGIYVAPPQKPAGGLPDDWTPWRVHPMDNSNGFDPNSLTPLLADLANKRVE
jgi:hypothetical protein